MDSLNSPQNGDEPDIDDLAEAVHAGRPLKPRRRFRVQIANETLSFSPFVLDDPLPLGRQLIEVTGGAPVHEYVAIAILPNGDFEDIRLDEPYDLRGRGAERILVARTDRKYLFKIDDRDLEWPRRFITGFVLKKLASLAANYALWLDVPGGHDQKIDDCDLIDLDKPGVERFISIIDQTTEGRELIPSSDLQYLESRNLTFDIVEHGTTPGVILKAFPLPAGKYDHETADILIILPAGYPDIAPDMFYASPWLRLSVSGREPRAANVAHNFAGRSWQRWSRHCQAWRPGIDGLQTMIARVQVALASAGA
ncbi:MAG: multiubiquitin domain-containing protein [Pseudomonadota bacterium]